MLGRVLLLLDAWRGVGSLGLHRVTQFGLHVASHRRGGDSQVLFRRPVGDLPAFLVYRLHRQAHVGRAGVHALTFARHARAYFARSFAGDQNL